MMLMMLMQMKMSSRLGRRRPRMRFRRRPRMALQRRGRRFRRRPRVLDRPRPLPRMSRRTHTRTRAPTPVHRPQIDLAATRIRTRIDPKGTAVHTELVSSGRRIRRRRRHTQNRTSLAIGYSPLPPRSTSLRRSRERRLAGRSNVHHRPHRITRAVGQRRGRRNRPEVGIGTSGLGIAVLRDDGHRR